MSQVEQERKFFVAKIEVGEEERGAPVADRGKRERLPHKRRSLTYKIKVRGSEGERSAFVTLGVYPDGRLGEIFLATAKAGSDLRTSLGTWATSVSLSLQYGMPPAQAIHTFRGVRCVPGTIECEDVPGIHGQQCGSLWDAVVRLIEAEVDQDGFHLDFRGG